MNLTNVMTNDIVVCSIDKSIYDAAKLMSDYDIGFLPIVSIDKVIGVITDRDIALAVSNVSNINKNIKDYITNRIIYLDYRKSIYDLLDLMKINKVKRVIITDDKEMIGIISLSDILRFDFNKDVVFDTIKSIYDLSDISKPKYKNKFYI